MSTIIVIIILWAVFSAIMKGVKNAAGSNPQNRGGAPNTPPYTRPSPPLTPTARPGTGAPDLGDLMTMLGGGQTRPPQDEDMEGVSTEYTTITGSLSGASMIDESQPDYEGKTLPGELSSNMVAMHPRMGISATPMARPTLAPKQFSSAAMRDAVVWAEILAKPKSMRRVAR